MAGLATFDLHGFMLEYEWAALFRVAGEAHRILRRGCSDLFGRNCAVRVVAVVTFNKPFVYPVMEGHGELRLLLRVTAVTKLRLFFNQQKFRIFAVVRRMAIQAAHVIFVVHGLRKIHLFFAGRVASEAALVDCFRAGRFEAENFLHVAGIIRVRRAGTVTSFAALMRRAAAPVQRCLKVRRFFVAVE